MSWKSTPERWEKPLATTRAFLRSSLPSDLNLFLRTVRQPITFSPRGLSTSVQVLLLTRDFISSYIASCHSSRSGPETACKNGISVAVNANCVSNHVESASFSSSDFDPRSTVGDGFGCDTAVLKWYCLAGRSGFPVSIFRGRPEPRPGCGSSWIFLLSSFEGSMFSSPLSGVHRVFQQFTGRLIND